MNIPRFPAVLLAAAFVPLGVQSQISSSLPPSVIVDTSAEPMAEGDFQPTWESLSQFEVPDWFRDAKFGIWAHWGPQCQPGWGDWYAREMYCEGEYRNRRHNADYGHPSVFGFKDVINEWKAENWYPEQLMALYRRAGARYFMALANHHDNFDNWDSKYQPWNSVNMGPRRDIIAQWAQAARKFGMKFGVSVHAAHAWSWYETSQGADKEGQLAGVPYDGRMTLADGLGKWWEGFDPQDLYEQRHAPAPGFEVPNSIHARWNWGNGVTQPDLAYCQKFYDRTMDLIVRYKPELIYFDDTALPLWPVSDAGLKIAAGFYNMNDGLHGDNGMLFGKVLTDDQRECMAWDIERGVSNRIEPHPWQTCTCLGQWHYDKLVLEEHRYKSAETVVHMLIDIVSKNGNLLLSVPLRGDGTPDSEELEILEGIAGWMEVNGEAIHGSRPWKVFGEGPQIASAAEIQAQGFNEGRSKPFTAEDVRFTTKDGALYAFVMGVPKDGIAIRSLGSDAKLLDGRIVAVSLLGSDESISWQQDSDALRIVSPGRAPCEFALVFKILSE
jgi:alpha-L-fucosidase